MPEIKKTPLSFLFFFLIFLLFSCSSSVPEIKNPEYSVVFTFSDSESLPTARLSVFAEAVSDGRRTENLELNTSDFKYTWTVDNVSLIQNSGRIWAGYTSFVMPDGKKIPQGVYVFSYESADGQRTEKTFTVQYNDELYNSNAAQAQQIMKDDDAQSKISIYDSTGKLIYYGSRTDELSSPEKIKKLYRSAAFFQEIKLKKDSSVICIMNEQTLE